jgi:hypothetical protein
MGCLMKSLNQGLIQLIPKNATRDYISRWRPISLLSVTYKIMAKVVALQVRDLAKKIVRKEKIEFVQWHFILDTVRSSWEAMEWPGRLDSEISF